MVHSDRVMTQKGKTFSQILVCTNAEIVWRELTSKSTRIQNLNQEDWKQKQPPPEDWKRGDSGGCLAMSSRWIWVEQMRKNQSPLQTGSWIDEKNGETGWEGKREGRNGESVIVSTDMWWQNLGAGCHFGTIRTDVAGGVQWVTGMCLPGLQYFPTWSYLEINGVAKRKSSRVSPHSWKGCFRGMTGA